MYDSDDLDQELGLDLPRDDDTLDSYEETPTTDLMDGYIVQNYHGFDIAVLGRPDESGLVSSGANPAHHASYVDEDGYRADVTLSPRPMNFDAAFRLKGEDIEIGTEQEGLTDDSYIELEERDQPGPAIRELMHERDDFRESAIERLGFYVLNEADGPVGDDRTTGIAAALSGDETVDPDVHERMQDLAHHYALDR